MSKKTDYKRLFRREQDNVKKVREAGLFYRDQAKASLVAMNWLLNYVNKLVTPEEFKNVLTAIGAEEKVDETAPASEPAETPTIITDPGQVTADTPTPEVVK